MSTYSKARCAICHKLFHHENGTAPVCDAICYEAYLRHRDDEKSETRDGDDPRTLIWQNVTDDACGDPSMAEVKP